MASTEQVQPCMANALISTSSHINKMDRKPLTQTMSDIIAVHVFGLRGKKKIQREAVTDMAGDPEWCGIILWRAQPFQST